MKFGVLGTGMVGEAIASRQSPPSRSGALGGLKRYSIGMSSTAEPPRAGLSPTRSI
jgi:hypothetical protein